MVHRSRRSGAQRRAQYKRADARAISHLLKAFDSLLHRGCSNTKLGGALVQALTPASAADAAAAAAPLRPPGIFFAQDAAGDPATTAYAQPAYEAPTYVAPTTTSYAQPAYAAPTYAAPATTADEQPPIIDFEGGVTVPLRATSPSIKVELYHTFKEEIDYVDWCVSKGTKPRTQNEQQRLAKAVSVIEILNLLCSLDNANG